MAALADPAEQQVTGLLRVRRARGHLEIFGPQPPRCDLDRGRIDRVPAGFQVGESGQHDLRAGKCLQIIDCARHGVQW